MPRTFAGMILHYGADYCGYAVRSVYDHVEKIVVYFTNDPSHGHGPGMLQRPETEEQILTALHAFDKDRKIEVVKGRWNDEGAHRNAMEDHCFRAGADEIIVLDADEIWPESYLLHCLERSRSSGARDLLVHMNHFYRSMHMACREPCVPRRIVRRDGAPKSIAYADRLDPSVLHFGYAQHSSLIAYKMSIHGHKNEIRSRWLQDIFMAWPNVRKDVHPTCTLPEGWWNPEPFDKAMMPQFMQSHPFFNLDVIP